VSLETVALIVMADAPHPGVQHARFSPLLSAQHAAAVHEAFVRHTASRLSGSGAPEIVMYFDPPAAGQAMQRLVGSLVTRLVAQPAGDRSARLEAAAREFGKWYGKLMFVGVDAPDVPMGHLVHAAELLRDNEVVIGPCSWGGSWCIGMQGHVSPAVLFDGVDWSIGNVCGHAQSRSRELDFSFSQAQAWDVVSGPDELQRLMSRLSSSSDEQDRKLLGSLGFVGQGVAR